MGLFFIEHIHLILMPKYVLFFLFPQLFGSKLLFLLIRVVFQACCYRISWRDKFYAILWFQVFQELIWLQGTATITNNNDIDNWIALEQK